jgi:hypothetical protein
MGAHTPARHSVVDPTRRSRFPPAIVTLPLGRQHATIVPNRIAAGAPWRWRFSQTPHRPHGRAPVLLQKTAEQKDSVKIGKIVFGRCDVTRTFRRRGRRKTARETVIGQASRRRKLGRCATSPPGEKFAVAAACAALNLGGDRCVT